MQKCSRLSLHLSNGLEKACAAAAGAHRFVLPPDQGEVSARRLPAVRDHNGLLGGARLAAHRFHCPQRVLAARQLPENLRVAVKFHLGFGAIGGLFGEIDGGCRGVSVDRTPKTGRRERKHDVSPSKVAQNSIQILRRKSWEVVVKWARD